MSTEGLFSIAGKTAVVTGGSRGIGLMIARGFVEAGAKVYISSRSAEVCDQVAAELSELPGGGKCVSLPADLSSEEGCRELAEAIKEREDSLDILVNNAGVNDYKPLRRIHHELWEKVLAVNLEAPFYMTRDLLPLLKEASRPDDPARVVNIGSVAGMVTTDKLDGYVYSCSKAAVHQLTAYLARRLAPEVTVNALALGPFESKMLAFSLKLFGKQIADLVPLKRIGRPEDVAGLTIYLSSRAGSYLTGTVIPVDGGLTT